MQKILLISLLAFCYTVSDLPAQDYRRLAAEGKLIVKLKPEHREQINNGRLTDHVLKKIIANSGGTELSRKFPRHKSPPDKKNKYQQPLTDLSLIYEFSFVKTEQVNKLIRQLVASNYFDYVEPVYNYHLLTDTLNDPGFVSQYHFENIKALLAYEIEKGDTNIVIGISDTGTDLAHPDLKENTKYNYADPIDGVDNDLDGYTDNFMGWDLSENDNNPQYDTHIHGIHVSGIADAVTNNNIGVAGVGYRCKFMPLKILDHNSVINTGYESIVYAADHGCSVVNCSWGGTGRESKYEQDIINYATFNQNCLVVAAAGNSNMDEAYYPASYYNVISVAATDKNDLKWGAGTTGGTASTYNCKVDISAPGVSIYSTLSGGTYGNSSGTSMAAPVVAGCAAIVKSRFPFLSAIQIGEQLKVTSDNIDNVNPPQFAGKLGYGRVNLYNAVTDTAKSSLVITGKTISDHGDGIYLSGDTLFISCSIINYLAKATGVTAVLSSGSSAANIISAAASFDTLKTGETKSNVNAPFKVKLVGNLSANQSLNFTISIFANNFYAKECFDIIVNTNYILCDANNLKTTFTSKGSLAYNDPYQLSGYGVSYKSNDNILANSSFMIGNSTAQVSDNLLSKTPNDFDYDFFSVSRVLKKFNGAISDFDLESTFDDTYAGATKLGVEVLQSSYAWADVPNQNFIIINYKIYNKGITPLGSVYAGLYTDWDILNFNLNKSSWHEASKLIYTYSTQPESMFAGVKLLNNLDKSVHYSMDNIDTTAFGVNSADGFSAEEKYITLSNNRDNSGLIFGAGNDVASVSGAGPFFLDVADTINVAFALVAGDSLPDLINSANQAQIIYNQHFVGLTDLTGKQDKLRIYPNPAQNELFIYSDRPVRNIEIYDFTGHLVKKTNGLLSGSIPLNGLLAGGYVVKLFTDTAVVVKKLSIVR